MDTIESAREYFLARCDEVISLSGLGNPWVFLCCSAMIDYLSRMTSAGSFSKFVERYFNEINPKYTTFKYSNGKQDLPLQMFYILRCGLVHSFSFSPGDEEIKNGARPGSIVIAHEKNGNNHLTTFRINKMDSVVFMAKQFSMDLKMVVELVFSKAESDNNLKDSILKYLRSYPPLQVIS